MDLTVGLLVASTCTRSTELLRFTPTRISDEQSPIVGNQNVLHLLLGALVHELLIVSDDGLADRLPDRVHLARVTSTLDSDPDVHIREPFIPEKEDGFEDFGTERLRLQELNRCTVDLDESGTPLAVSNSDRGFLCVWMDGWTNRINQSEYIDQNHWMNGWMGMSEWMDGDGRMDAANDESRNRTNERMEG